MADILISHLGASRLSCVPPICLTNKQDVILLKMMGKSVDDDEIHGQSLGNMEAHVISGGMALMAAPLLMAQNKTSRCAIFPASMPLKNQ